MGRQRYYFSDKLAARRSRRFKIYILAFLIIAASASSAWSSEPAVTTDPAVDAGSSSSPLSATDTCLPLLKTIRHISPDKVADKTQRSAGKLAVLGYVFGFRFALGPVQTPEHSQHSAKVTALVDYRQPSGDANGRNVLATLAYRHCRKSEALSTLASARPEF